MVSTEERQSVCIGSGRPDPPMEMTNASSEGRHKPMALEVWGIHGRHQDCSEQGAGPSLFRSQRRGILPGKECAAAVLFRGRHGTTNKPASPTVGTPRPSKAATPACRRTLPRRARSAKNPSPSNLHRRAGSLYLEKLGKSFRRMSVALPESSDFATDTLRKS